MVVYGFHTTETSLFKTGFNYNATLILKMNDEGVPKIINRGYILWHIYATLPLSRNLLFRVGCKEANDAPIPTGRQNKRAGGFAIDHTGIE